MTQLRAALGVKPVRNSSKPERNKHFSRRLVGKKLMMSSERHTISLYSIIVHPWWQWSSRRPTKRHISRTHRVALDWLFDRINLDPMIQSKFRRHPKPTRPHPDRRIIHSWQMGQTSLTVQHYGCFCLVMQSLPFANWRGHFKIHLKEKSLRVCLQNRDLCESPQESDSLSSATLSTQKPVALLLHVRSSWSLLARRNPQRWSRMMRQWIDPQIRGGRRSTESELGETWCDVKRKFEGPAFAPESQQPRQQVVQNQDFSDRISKIGVQEESLDLRQLQVNEVLLKQKVCEFLHLDNGAPQQGRTSFPTCTS